MVGFVALVKFFQPEYRLSGYPQHSNMLDLFLDLIYLLLKHTSILYVFMAMEMVKSIERAFVGDLFTVGYTSFLCHNDVNPICYPTFGLAEGVWSSSGQWCAVRGRKGKISNPRSVLLLGKAFSSDPEGDGPKRKRNNNSKARKFGWHGTTSGTDLTSLSFYIDTKTFELNGTKTKHRISQKATESYNGWSMRYFIPRTKYKAESSPYCGNLDASLWFKTQEDAEATTNIIQAVRVVLNHITPNQPSHTQTLRVKDTGSSSSSSSSSSSPEPNAKRRRETPATTNQYTHNARNVYFERMKFRTTHYKFAEDHTDNPDMYKEWFDKITRMSTRTVNSRLFKDGKKKILVRIQAWKRRKIRDRINYDHYVYLKKIIASSKFRDLIIPINSNSHKKKKRKKNKKARKLARKLFVSNITHNDITWTTQKTLACCCLAKELMRTQLQTDLSFDSDFHGTLEEACASVAQHFQRSGRTIRRWWKEFTDNKKRFKESYKGKYLRSTIFDENEAMKKHAIGWLEERIMAKNTKANPNPVFRMKDWHDYLNEDGGLLDSWEVPADALHRVNLLQEPGYVKTKKYLTVSIQTATRWAKNLGVSFENVHKSYYVDGHNDDDIIDYRQNKWLPQEEKEELRQYRWFQMEVEHAKLAGIAYIDGIDAAIRKIESVQKKKRVGSIPQHIIEEAMLRRKDTPKPSWETLAKELSVGCSTRKDGGYVWNKTEKEWEQRYNDTSTSKTTSATHTTTSTPSASSTTATTATTTNNCSSSSSSSSSSSTTSTTTTAESNTFVVTSDGLRKAAQRKVVLLDESKEEDKAARAKKVEYLTCLSKEMLHFYDDEQGVKMVELHIDLVPITWRQHGVTIQNRKYSVVELKIHGIKTSMGGNLSVRYNQDYWGATFKGEKLPPVGIKVGTDEVNFKMYAMSKKYWIINGVKKIAPKTEGKGNMKVAWVDEVFGLAYNHLPTALLLKFQNNRPKRNVSREGGVLAHNPGTLYMIVNTVTQNQNI